MISRTVGGPKRVSKLSFKGVGRFQNEERHQLSACCKWICEVVAYLNEDRFSKTDNLGKVYFPYVQKTETLV